MSVITRLQCSFKIMIMYACAVSRRSAADDLFVRSCRPRDWLRSNQSAVWSALDAGRTPTPGQPGHLADGVLRQRLLDGDHVTVGSDCGLRPSAVSDVSPIMSYLVFFHIYENLLFTEFWPQTNNSGDDRCREISRRQCKRLCRKLSPSGLKFSSAFGLKPQPASHNMNVNSVHELPETGHHVSWPRVAWVWSAYVYCVYCI